MVRALAGEASGPARAGAARPQHLERRSLPAKLVLRLFVVGPRMNASLRWMLLLGAIVAWTGLGLQTAVSLELLGRQGFSAVATLSRMLAYFTILTNLLVAGYFSLRLLAPQSAIGQWLAQPALGSGIAMFVTLVCVIVHLILRHLQQLTGLAFIADTILHYVTPILFVIFWIGWVPKRTLAWRHALWWSLYPLAYFVYAMVRGPISEFYPYPFIDVAKLGYATVAVNAVLISVAFVLAGLAVIALDRRWPESR
jgi:hypothetical protein